MEPAEAVRRFLDAGNHQAARDAWQQALTTLEQLEHPDAEQVRSKLAAYDASTTDSGEWAAPA